VASIYLFHTGKSRWVISKRIDDGTRCYAFIKDTSDSPLNAQGSWAVCDQDGEWKADSNVVMSAAGPSNDKFAQLRMTLDGELDHFKINDTEHLKQLWKRLDFNGNGVVSLAEIDKMVVEMVAGGTWPEWLNNKPALMRAYKKTILKDGDGDDWVEKHEFHALLLNIFWFNKLWKVFEVIDSGADRRIDAGEFAQGMSALGLRLSQSEVMDEFNKIDTNHGGQVLFVEFCAYVRHRVNPDANPAFDGDIISGEKCGKVMRRHHGHRATHTHHVKKKAFVDFDELEVKIKAAMQDHKKLKDMWRRIDFNGNNIVSLAEIDKMVVEAYPLLNHKPALMRAYKATIHGEGSNGDDWVQKKEFKALLGNLFYFNKLFWLFHKADPDNDRRLTEKEFTHCLCICGVKMSKAEMHRDFQKVDKNGGGIILFDEFCKYFTMKACPECMSALVD
jgi:Ca2+-binding EF-hand superfamily protein